MKQAEDFLKEIGFSVLEENSPPLNNEVGGGEFSFSKSELYQKIESRAVYLLGMREHGAKELTSKLLTKFPETPELLSEYQEVSGFVANVIDEVLRHCQENNWQSDERYIEQSVRNWALKGCGPIKIRQKLQHASSRDDLIDAYLDWDDSEWLDLALEVLLKKYGDTRLPSDRKEQVKRMRFLQSRGFSSELIWKAFRMTG